MKCAVDSCNEEENQNNTLHFHHIIPVSIGGTDKDGRIYLCKKHHDILHNMLLKFVWNCVENKEGGKKAIKIKTEWFLGEL